MADLLEIRLKTAKEMGRERIRDRYRQELAEDLVSSLKNQTDYKLPNYGSTYNNYSASTIPIPPWMSSVAQGIWRIVSNAVDIIFTCLIFPLGAPALLLSSIFICFLACRLLELIAFTFMCIGFFFVIILIAYSFCR